MGNAAIRLRSSRVFMGNSEKRYCDEMLWVPELAGALVRDSPERAMKLVNASPSGVSAPTPPTTRSEGSELRCKSCSTAEAPRRQVAQVGERRSTSRGPSVDLSKDSSNRPENSRR